MKQKVTNILVKVLMIICAPIFILFFGIAGILIAIFNDDDYED